MLLGKYNFLYLMVSIPIFIVPYFQNHQIVKPRNIILFQKGILSIYPLKLVMMCSGITYINQSICILCYISCLLMKRYKSNKVHSIEINKDLKFIIFENVLRIQQASAN